MPEAVERRIINGRDCAVLRDLGGGLFHESSLIEFAEGREVLRTYPIALADELERQWQRWREAGLGLGTADLVGFTEVGTLEGRPFVLRRCVEAQSFDVHVRRAKFNWRSPEDALEVGQAICRPIAALHRLGLLHGHVTNNNVFFGPDGAPVLTDPWLAHPTAMMLHHARKGAVRPGGLAPEQQHLRTKVDARTDVWALGLLLCRLYTHKLDLVVNQRVLMELHGAKLPIGLLKVLWQAIQEDAANRFPDAGTLATALAEVTLAEHQRTVHVRPAPLAKGVGDGMNPALKKAAIVVVAVGVVAGGATLLRSGPASQRRPAAQHATPTATPVPSPAPSPRVEASSNKWNLEVPGAEAMTLVGILPFGGRLGHPSEKNNPPHEVGVTRSFSIAATTVTVAQFSAFVRATSYVTTAETAGGDTNKQVWTLRENKIAPQPGLNWRNPGFPQQPNHPVTCVSWDDAQAFCVWLAGRTGKQVRLPTESEWEYSARAGSESTYWWGDDPAGASGRANVAEQSFREEFPGWMNIGAWKDGFSRTAPVGSFQPNALGLYDMGGNVWEWCQDRYSETFPPTRVFNWEGPGEGTVRSFRGSAYNEYPPHGLSYRYGNAQTIGANLRGFRVVVVGTWQTLSDAKTVIPAAQVTRSLVGSFLAIEGKVARYTPPSGPQAPHVYTLVDRSPDPVEVIYWDYDAGPAVRAKYGQPAVGDHVVAAGYLADYKGRLQVRVERVEQIRVRPGG